MVESYIDRTGCGDELFSFGIDRQQSVIFDVLVDKTHNQRLADHGSPITDVMVRTGPEPFALVVSVTLNQRGILTDQHAGQVIRLELVPQVAQRLERHAKRRLGVDLGFGVEAVVAAAAVLLGIFLPEIVQQRLATAHRTFGVRHGFEQQQLADLLLGHRLALHELLQLLNILITIKVRQCPSPPSRPARPVS